MEICTATEEMFDGIYPLLSELGDAFTKEDWRRLVDYRFSDQAGRGWVAMAGREIVGFLGAIFSQREGARFCGLTSWIMKHEHRKASLDLLAPVFQLKDHTLLNFSPTAFTTALFKQLGFKVLDEELLVIPPVTPSRAPNTCRAVTQPASVRALLGAARFKMWSDHQPYEANHLVLEGPGGPLYVVSSKTTFRNLPVSFVHHVSDARLFADRINRVQRELWWAHQTLLTLVDKRLVGQHPPRGAAPYRLAHPRLYRPAEPAPRGPIDSLYTELVVLNPRRWSFTG